METLITKGIQVSAQCLYEEAQSEPGADKFLFSYEITISNRSQDTVQLLRRHWIIFDSLTGIREIEGEGVVGLQPVLAPGQSHVYNSWCPLNSDIGHMAGKYLIINLSTQTKFDVYIPGFTLMSTQKMN